MRKRDEFVEVTGPLVHLVGPRTGYDSVRGYWRLLVVVVLRERNTRHKLSLKRNGFQMCKKPV